MPAPSKGNNPAKRKKGEECNAKEHHKGKMATTYQDDAIERSKTFSKRNKTIVNKVSYFNFFLFDFF